MTGYVALLRAVNVGGTGKLPMATLVQMCETVGLGKVKPTSPAATSFSEAIGSRIRFGPPLRISYTPTPAKVGVIVRNASEIANALARNPFADAPGNRVMTLFVDGPLPADPLDEVTGIKNEEVRLGNRELFVLYPDGMANTRLRIPSDKHGTARNMNTVAKLAEMTEALA